MLYDTPIKLRYTLTIMSTNRYHRPFSDFQCYNLTEDPGNKRKDTTRDSDLLLDLCPPRWLKPSSVETRADTSQSISCSSLNAAHRGVFTSSIKASCPPSGLPACLLVFLVLLVLLVWVLMWRNWLKIVVQFGHSWSTCRGYCFRWETTAARAHQGSS